MEVRTMSKINEMIKELCPNGVERVKLGEIAKLLRGKVISKTYVLEHPGIYPVYSSQTANNGEFGRIDSYMFDGKYITWTTDGIYAGTIFKREGKFNITNICGLINLNDERAIVDFVYYWLTIATDKYVNRAADNPKLMSNVVETIEIPLPPLPIQREIVNILDKFSSLIDNLDETIKLRQKQYEYYREKLLTFKDGECKWKKLGDCCSNISSGRCSSKLLCGKYPVYGSTGIIAHSDSYEYSADKILIARVGANAGFVQIAKGLYDVTDNALVVHLNEDENLKYIYYLLINRGLNQYAKGGGQPLITGKEMKDLSFAFPPLNRQQEIVATLDKFEAMISNLKQERELRQKQYEFYREKLLTFE